jgi:2,4-dienoyl-CoA reductase-like NADH-dependent reductase (Old Yellow Enzyme family)
MEAASVVPEGRITPEDAGIWSDEFIDAYRPIVEFAHSQNQKIGIQVCLHYHPLNHVRIT